MSQKVARSWIVALLAAGLGLWFAFARSTTREPVPVALTPNDAGTATPAQVAEPAGHGLGQPAAGTHVIAARQQAPELGLAGVVVDDLGAPLARVMVSLHQVGSVVRGADLCNADHYGRFAFPKARGTVRVSIENDLVAPHEVTIADGERRFVELRATEPCIQLEGTVWSGPNPVRDRLVTVRAAEDPLRLVAAEGTNDDGYYSQALRPGRYVLEVGGIALQGASVAPPYALGILELTAARRRVRRDIVLPLAEIRVTVHHAADHAPARGVRVRAVATTQTLERCVTSDQDGKAVFAELPAATWRVQVESDHHAAQQEQEVVILGTGGETRAVSLLLIPAGTVSVVFDRAAQREAAAFGLIDPLAPNEVGAFVLHLQVGGRLLGRAAPTASLRHTMQFGPVPVGRHTLRCEDRMDPDGIVYAPVQPFVREGIEVRAGGTTRVTVACMPRTVLALSIVDRVGDPWPLGFSVVGAGGAVKFANRSGLGGAAFVPPGVYKVSVLGPPVFELQVEVTNQEVWHTVQVPGLAPRTARSPLNK